MIVPIVKKGEGISVEEYRGVSLTSSLYKVYATVLANRLKAEVEEKVDSTEPSGVPKGFRDN